MPRSDSAPQPQPASASGEPVPVDALQPIDWERWKKENKAAIDAYNERVAREGPPLAKYRSF